MSRSLGGKLGRGWQRDEHHRLLQRGTARGPLQKDLCPIRRRGIYLHDRQASQELVLDSQFTQFPKLQNIHNWTLKAGPAGVVQTSAMCSWRMRIPKPQKNVPSVGSTMLAEEYPDLWKVNHFQSAWRPCVIGPVHWWFPCFRDDSPQNTTQLHNPLPSKWVMYQYWSLQAHICIYVCTILLYFATVVSLIYSDGNTANCKLVYTLHIT